MSIFSKIKNAISNTVQKLRSKKPKQNPTNKNTNAKPTTEQSNRYNLADMDNDQAFDYVANMALKAPSPARLIELGEAFKIWLNNKTTAQGNPLTTNYKRSLVTKCINRIQAADVMHHDLKGNIAKLANTHPKYSSQVKELLVIKDSSYVLAQVIGTNKGSLIRGTVQSSTNGFYHALKQLKVHSVIVSWIRKNAIDIQEKDMQDSVNSNNLKHKLMNTATVKMVDIEKIITDGLNPHSVSYGKLLVSLALATGRRSIELLHTGSFKAIAGKQDQLMFEGQAKRRKGIKSKAYLIYVVGCTPDEVLNGVERLRSHKDVAKTLKEASTLPKIEQNAFIKRRTQSNKSEAVKRSFNNNPKRTFKDCRAIYSRYCVDKKKPSNMDSIIFLKDLLGHAGIQEQAHYRSFNIDHAISTPTRSAPIEHFTNKLQGASGTGFDGLESIIESLKMHGKTKKALLLLNDKVKAFTSDNPATPITKTLIYKTIGCSKNVADRYLGAKDMKGNVKVIGLAEAVAAKYNKSIQGA